ncbi:MAG: hypothetical protein Q8Q02_04855 [Nocardioides sp.]|nr:hypothetical protein [Nocardioides sp.]
MAEQRADEDVRPGDPGAAEESFDAFYRATRDDLLVSTFALTADQTAARAAVRDAYTAAWHHWRKVSHLEEPLDWVRPRAWRDAQRRHTARLGRRDRSLDPMHARLLTALAALDTGPRKAVLLRHLAGVPMSRSARELGQPLAVAAEWLQTGTAELASALDLSPDMLPAVLRGLRVVTDQTTLPRPPLLRRAGRKRRQVHTAVASFVAVVLTVAAGALVHAPTSTGTAVGPASPPELPPPPLSRAMLLDAVQVGAVGADGRWEVETTGDNTRGDGINSVCQTARFADPDGSEALVRRFSERGGAERSRVQTVELSRTERQAEQAFETTTQWYAGCSLARLQLITTHEVVNTADEGYLLTLRVAERPVTTYTVAVARTGRLTTSVVTTTTGDRGTPTQRSAQLLANAVGGLCESPAAGACAAVGQVRPVAPLAAGEEPGLVAVIDLPAVGRVNEPWAGTSPAPASPNPATTTCDDTDFIEAGARAGSSRTFVIPEADLPVQFGVATSFGRFRAQRRAEGAFQRAVARLAGCEDRDLASSVQPLARTSDRRAGTELAIWQVTTEISDNEVIRFRTALVRAEKRVAQITFTPAGGLDIDAASFRALAERALERLGELG